METDPAIKAENLRFPGPASELLGYLARPAAPGTYPGIVIIHENQGLIPLQRRSAALCQGGLRRARCRPGLARSAAAPPTRWRT